MVHSKHQPFMQTNIYIVNTYHFKIPSLEKMQNNSIQHNANDIDFEWILIKELTQDIKVKKMQPCLIMKTKFLVQLAAAKTIQQAQGLTMDELLFHPTDVPYATLSHICTEEKLHFSAPLHFYPDNFHITIKKKWQNYQVTHLLIQFSSILFFPTFISSIFLFQFNEFLSSNVYLSQIPSHFIHYSALFQLFSIFIFHNPHHSLYFSIFNLANPHIIRQYTFSTRSNSSIVQLS